MLLFPDVTREQHESEHFVFSVPCTLDEWRKLCTKQHWVDNHYVSYVILEEDKEPIAIILVDSGNTDDEALTLAAHLRMVSDFTGMIYALPYTTEPPDHWIGNIIARTAGVDPKKVRHVEVK